MTVQINIVPAFFAEHFLSDEKIISKYSFKILAPQWGKISFIVNTE
jgi:hypothetical protein